MAEQPPSVRFVQEEASEVPWYRFTCEDCGASRDQRLRNKYTLDQLAKCHITCAGRQAEGDSTKLHQAYIVNADDPTLGECLVDWWTADDGTLVGSRAPSDFMQPSARVRPAGWLRKVVTLVKRVLSFLAGEG